MRLLGRGAASASSSACSAPLSTAPAPTPPARARGTARRCCRTARERCLALTLKSFGECVCVLAMT
eukprot:6991524-Pyramimonas_sp.AAC.1